MYDFLVSHILQWNFKKKNLGLAKMEQGDEHEDNEQGDGKEEDSQE